MTPNKKFRCCVRITMSASCREYHQYTFEKFSEKRNLFKIVEEETRTKEKKLNEAKIIITSCFAQQM